MQLIVKIARTLEEREQAFRIRYNVFAEELGRLDMHEHKNNKEYDAYDYLNATTNFLAFQGNIAVGTLRLIEDSTFGFIMDNLFDLSELRASGRILAEGSRFAVLKKYRPDKSISLGLIKIFHNYAIHKGLTDVCITSAANNVVKLYERIGYHQIGNPAFYEKFNDYIIPMRIELNKILEPFKTLFEDPSDYIEEPYNSSKLPIKV